MGKREDTLEQLRLGLTPGQIAQKFNVSVNTTLGYLDQMVGCGVIRRSDILFTIPPKNREAIRCELSKDMSSRPNFNAHNIPKYLNIT